MNSGTTSVPSAAMAQPSGGVDGCSVVPMYHPAARRPISIATSPRFLLYPLDDDNYYSSKRKSSSKKKRNRLSLPASGASSERGRDLTGPATSYTTRPQEGTCTSKSDIVSTSPRHVTDSHPSRDMAQLITLQLQPRTYHKRQPSCSNLMDIMRDVPLQSPPPPPKIPAKNKRRSLSIPRPVTVAISSEEWKRSVKEVKLLFSKRYWKGCVTKCKRMLVDVPAQPNIHPLHSVYLAFYTAIALEQTARSTPGSANVKLSLLQEAITYLRQSKTLISSAYVTSPTPEPNSRTSQRSSRRMSFPVKPSPTYSDASTISSARSSLFSPVPTPSTAASFTFPTKALETSYPGHRRQSSSVINFSHKRNTSSTSSAILRPAPLRVQKRVSFSSSTDDLIIVPSLPHPTTTSSSSDSSPAPLPKVAEMENWELINSFPMPPSPSRCPSLVADSESEDDYFSLTSSSSSSSPCYEKQQQHSRRAPSTAAIAHYHASLCAFESQINWHTRSVEKQIASMSDELSATTSPSHSTTGIEAPQTEDEKKADLQRRIAVRRRAGWKRERFDGSRYQRLCEEALEEVDGVLVH